MESGLSLKIIWWDDDLLSIEVRAWNGRFGGTVELYDRPDVFPRVANAFRGFPTHLADHRTLELGTFDPARAGGGARLQLLCTDRSGHVALHVYLRTATSPERDSECEEARFVVNTQASQIDDFVARLDAIKEPGIDVQARLARTEQ